ncbi:MAG: hypothetical protein NXH75_10125 [Halobacteriovoraceae bacterium]|nr:hypothetical protein [Halobacteriovoraceae bacterium]
MKLIAFFSIFCSFFCASIDAAQVGIVTSAKAVIYADIEMKSPIGYVKKGKQIAVGNVKRRRGEILPVVINGKIGWVRVQDLRLPDEERDFDRGKKVTEHEVLIDEKVKDPLDQNNFVTLRTGPSGVEISAQDSETGELTEALDSATETSLMFEHKNPYFSTHWGFGLEFFQGKLGVFSFRSANIKGGISYVPIRLSWTSLEIYGNALLSGDFRVESEGIGEYKGNMFGLDYGAMLRLLPEYRLGIVIGGGMTYYKFTGLEDIQIENGDNIFQVSGMSGVKYFAGLSYKF